MTRRRRRKSKKADPEAPAAPGAAGEAVAGRSFDTHEARDDASRAAAAAAPLPHGRIARRLTVVLAVHLVLIASVLAVAVAYRPAVRLAGFDAVVRPESKVELRARLLADGPTFTGPLAFLEREVSGLEIEFVDAGSIERLPAIDADAPPAPGGATAAVVATARTDATGTAVAEIDAIGDAGVRLYVVRAPAVLGLDRAEAPLVLSVVPEQRPLLLCDLDELVADATGATPGGPAAADGGLAGVAAEVAVRAAERSVVYVTARPAIIARETRSLLASAGFPAGPLLLRDPSESPLRAPAFKAGVRDALRRGWKDIAFLPEPEIGGALRPAPIIAPAASGPDGEREGDR